MFVNSGADEATTEDTSTTTSTSTPAVAILTKGLRLLLGHTSPETAFVQPDYPYGRRLRCQRRCWIETDARHGQRFCAQTTDPKRAYEHWNAPKKSTYSALAVMFLDERPGDTEGYVGWNGLSGHESEATIESFASRYAEALTDEHARKRLLHLRAASRVASKITYRIVEAGTEGDRLTDKEQRRAIGGMMAREVALLEAQT